MINKKWQLSLVFVVLLLLISINFTSSITANKQNNESNSYKIYLKNGIKDGKAMTLSTSAKTIFSNSKKVFTMAEAEVENSNTIVSSGSLEEYHPSMAVDGYDAFVAYEQYDDVNQYSRVHVRSSQNFGNNWSSSVKLEDEFIKDLRLSNLTYPAVAVSPLNQGYVTFISDKKNSSDLNLVKFNNIADLSSSSLSIVDWSNFGFKNFSKPDIVACQDSKYPWVVAFIGSTNFTDNETGEGPCKKSPMINFISPEEPYDENNIIIFWEPDFQNCSNLSMSTDYYGSNDIFGVCEIQNNSKQDLLFFKGNPEYWYEEDHLINKTLTSADSLIHPDIFVKNNNVSIIAEKEDKELVLFHSSDNGESWTTHNIGKEYAPIADFSFSAERLKVSFSDRSIDIDGEISTWNWDFGDGNTSTSQNPVHIYSNPGVYTVNLTVKDNDNKETNLSKNIEINNTAPLADFIYTPMYPIKNHNISFNSTSTVFSGRTITNHTWDLDDGTTLFDRNITHQYKQNGTYHVKLKIVDNTGAADTVEKTVYVGLNADFTISTEIADIGETVYFNDSSIATGSSITNWTWDFDDGSSLVEERNTSHAYYNHGIYYVSLTVKDIHNNTDKITKKVTVKPDVCIPKNPLVFSNDTRVFCAFTMGANIVQLVSSDNGKNWSQPNLLNSHFYSVLEGYRNADMPDANHVVWTDYREGNDDIYLYIGLALIPRLMVVPDSIELDKDIRFLKTKNWITFTVKNNGNGRAEDIDINISYKCRNDSQIYTSVYQGYLSSLEPGNVKKCRIPLFLFKPTDLFNSLIDFAGIETVFVTVDPNGELEDTAAKNETYATIFPKLARFEQLLIKLKGIIS